MKKVLIIGSEGNIGKPLFKYLLGKGYEVRGADIRQGWKENYTMADINFATDILGDFLDFQPDVVFILSAMVSRVTCEQAASLAVATNLLGVQNILELCKRINAMTVFFSTSEVYGPEIQLMNEDINDPKPNNRYGLTKLLGEKLVEYEVKTNKLKAVTLRPFMMYDEDEDIGEHRSAMIRFATNLALKKPIEVHTGSKRGWLHVSDAVKAIERAAYVKEYNIINIGHPDIRTIEELAELVRLNLNAEASLIKYIQLPEQMTLIKNPTLLKQSQILRVDPEVSLEIGVEKVCKKIYQRLKDEDVR